MQKFTTRTTILAVIFACALAATARAECGDLTRLRLGASLHRQSWGGPDFGQASLLLVSDSSESIVGFWRYAMVSQGTDGIPDGTIIDQGFSQWHSDGTEITNNASRAPATSDLCLGAWKKVAGQRYTLSHYGISWDTNNNFVGLAHITQNVTVSRGKDSFLGTFTIDQFDQSGNTLIHIQGNITGTRITADSPTIVAF